MPTAISSLAALGLPKTTDQTKQFYVHLQQIAELLAFKFKAPLR